MQDQIPEEVRPVRQKIKAEHCNGRDSRARPPTEKRSVGKFVKGFRRIVRRIRKSKYMRIGYCNICGRTTVFCCLNAFTLTEKKERNDLFCILCNSVARNRALAAALLDVLQVESKNLRDLHRCCGLRNLYIYSAGCQGPIHESLRALPHYVGSEYFPEVPPGTVHQGFRCEDLQVLSFADASFDVVISEDVMEHVRHPITAFQEVHRVLKPGGHYVFTVPLYGDNTVTRVDTTTDVDVHLLPAFYHGDPLRKEGALAYNDFGRDIVDLCNQQGFDTKLVEYEAAGNLWLSGDVIVASKCSRRLIANSY
jgi:SAM-dependent methyltransferase